MRSGTGRATRYSTTVRYNMLYRAFHQTGAGQERIVRVAVPLTDIDNVIDSFRRSLLAGLAVAAAAGLVLAWIFSRHLSSAFSTSGAVFRGSGGRLLSAELFSRPTARTRLPCVEQHLNEMSLKIRDNLQQVIGGKRKSRFHLALHDRRGAGAGSQGAGFGHERASRCRCFMFPPARMFTGFRFLKSRAIRRCIGFSKKC